MDGWNEQQKAAHAQALLDDPMIGSFFAAMQARLFSEWVQSAEGEDNRREWLWQRQKVLGEFEAYLRGYIASGELLTHAEQVNGQR